MIDILWLIICIAIGLPFILNPKKIVARPGCKIKSPMVVRILGIVIILLGSLSVGFLRF